MTFMRTRGLLVLTSIGPADPDGRDPSLNHGIRSISYLELLNSVRVRTFLSVNKIINAPHKRGLFRASKISSRD